MKIKMIVACEQYMRLFQPGYFLTVLWLRTQPLMWFHGSKVLRRMKMKVEGTHMLYHLQSSHMEAFLQI